MIDPSTLSMKEIIQALRVFQQELTRRFERHIALVFSDVVGTTEYFARFGDAAGYQLQQLHIDLLRDCLSTRNGRIVDTAGDGAFMTFPDANAAIDALIDFQKQISRENVARARNRQLQVRVGMHWGPVLTDGEVVSGDSVNLCARIGAAAGVGEIRLTRDMFHAAALEHRLHCRPVGRVELKGISQPVELLALDWRDQSMFPTQCCVEETGEEVILPKQDVISFGRLREYEGSLANDVALALPDADRSIQISRWHFELRLLDDGFRLHSLSDNTTEVDGALIAKGQDARIKPGSKVRVPGVLTLVFSASRAQHLSEDAGATMIRR